MLNEQNIKQAVDNRLSGLTAAETRRIRILRAAQKERQEDKPVRRTKTLVIAIALIGAMLTSAIAVAETFNLFDFFGKEDARYAALAPKATLEIKEGVLVNHPYLGNVEAEIDSAYFNGEELILAYRISNAFCAEEYTPTPAELAGMTKTEPKVFAVNANYPFYELVEAYNEAVENGTPFGFRQCTVNVSDHTCTDDGIDLGPWEEGDCNYDENGVLSALIAFNSHLPDRIRERDSLTITKEVRQYEYIIWFDGKDSWLRYAMQTVGQMIATVPRTEE